MFETTDGFKNEDIALLNLDFGANNLVLPLFKITYGQTVNE